MERESPNGLTARGTKEITRMTRNTDLASFNGKTGGNTKDNGLMGNNMGKVP